MILTGKIFARVVIVLILGVILQLSFFSQVTLFDVSPDMLPALVVCFGLLGGTMSGAVVFGSTCRQSSFGTGVPAMMAAST